VRIIRFLGIAWMIVFTGSLIGGCSLSIPAGGIDPPSQTLQIPVTDNGKTSPPTPDTGTQVQIETPASPPASAIPPTLTPTPQPSPQPTSTPDLRLDPALWRSWSILPAISPHTLQILGEGVENGNDGHVFSVIGDCQSVPNVFLGIYETNRYWFSDDFSYLEETIDYYRGSFSRLSLSVKKGMSPSSALSPLWANPDFCTPEESPVQCELRIRRPAIMFINLGTNWPGYASTVPYEKYLRQIMDIVIENHTLPVLMTKADNVEGDWSINWITAKVAYDYDVPLVNFWRAAQPLENHGLGKDSEYLTPEGWDRRNFISLQTLDLIRNQMLESGSGR